MSAIETPAKLPSRIQRRSSKTEAATQHQFPFSDLDVEDGIMDQLSLAGTPTVQRNTTTTTSKVRRSRVSVIVSGADTTTAPTRGAPIASAPAWVTGANFMAHRHSHGECLAHPSGRGCDCEMVQLPSMDQSAAWKVMAQRFKAVHVQHGLLAPPFTGANAPLHRRDRSVPIPHRARSAETPSPTAPLPHRPSSGASAPLGLPQSDAPPRIAISNAPQAEGVRRVSWNPHVDVFRHEPVLARNLARSTGPEYTSSLPSSPPTPLASALPRQGSRAFAAFSAPHHLPAFFKQRVATKLALQAVGHDCRTRAFGSYFGSDTYM